MLTTILALAAVASPSVEILAPGPLGELKGTLTKADPAAPVVLIIPGSGPTDRDGNSPLGITAAPYRLLADGLAVNGVATVRIDKRGMFGSSGAVSDANAVTIGDYVDDIHAWIHTIGNSTGADCVWVLGHSEGGLVALAAAQQEQSICGIVLVAAPGRPLGDIIKEQLRGNPANAPFLSEAETAIDSLAAGERVETAELPAPLASLFDPAIQGFLISALSLDPATLAGGFAKPILILQGDSDLQVGMRDAEILSAAAPKANLVRLTNMNHVLKVVDPDDLAGNIASYANPTLPLAPGVIDAIVDFIHLHSRFTSTR